jgi:hypothetical protein
MVRNNWRLLTAEHRPRHFGDDDEAWYRYPTVSEFDRAPIGKKRLQRLRSASSEARADAAAEFAAKVSEFLPPAAWLTYMPSSTRRSSESDLGSIEHLFLSALRGLRSDVVTVEPLVRASPVPCLHEEKVREFRDVSLLTSTLEPTQMGIDTELLYVADDMVQSGATYAAFRSALAQRWPSVRTVLLALVFSPRTSNPSR